MKELYKQYRPVAFKNVMGQAKAVTMLEAMVSHNKVPQAMLFTGPSGTGKTTLARIVKDELQCDGSDYKEMNCSSYRGIDMVRDIEKQVGYAPMNGVCRVWVLDECHQMTTPAQDAFLKMLEDTPSHVYFFLCTTDPQKLKKTIRTRCTDVHLTSLTVNEIKKLIKRVSKQAKINVHNDVPATIAKVADGSARQALVLLNQIHLLDLDDQVQHVLDADVETAAIELAKALMSKKHWSTIRGILRGLQNEDAEQLRYMILGYGNSALIKGWGDPNRAYQLINGFQDNFYDSKLPGLAAACWEVTNDM